MLSPEEVSDEKDIQNLCLLIERAMERKKVNGIANIWLSRDNSNQSILHEISTLINHSGIGALKPNSITIRFPTMADSQEYQIFKRVIEDAIKHENDRHCPL